MTPPQRAPLASLALLCASSLSYEVLLIRLFSIIQWHHFAYMIISLALLGYGASGAFLTFAQRRLLARYPQAYLAHLLLFGAALLPCFLAAQQIAFNPEQLLWDPRQLPRLLATYLLLATPFFFTANAIALTLARHRDRISRVYACDLIGSGSGGLAALLLLFVAAPLDALTATALLAAIAAGGAAAETGLVRRPLWLVPIAVLPALIGFGGRHAALAISPYKELNQTLQASGAQVVAQLHSPLGLLHIAANPQTPFRYAPGLSLTAHAEPPPQIAIFTDGGAMTVVTRDRGVRADFEYLDRLPSALPYHLRDLGHVLVLGAGGGADVLQARHHGVPRIDAVELNPQIINLVGRDYGEFSGGLYRAPGVAVHAAEARGFIAETADRYDLIQIALLDSAGASAAGLHALRENYLYTVEALRSYLRRLEPGGYLAITRWIDLPPRDLLKLFATAVEALRGLGVGEADRHLILIRGWQTGTLIVTRAPVSAAEISALRRFCTERAFDTAYYPGMPAGEANRYNVMPEPYFFTAAQALLSPGRAAYLERYKFNLQPATDDRPYFFNFFKWRSAREILRLRGRGGAALVEWGYLVLLATLVQALVASALLIALPIGLRPRTAAPRRGSRARAVRVLCYFTAIGLAFLFLEIACIQKFTLLLHHPIYSAALVITAFLVFAGLGSAWSQRYGTAAAAGRGLRLAIAMILAIGALYLGALGPLFAAAMAQPVAVKVIIGTTLIAPLAFFMGMPFPLALARVAADDPGLLPWSWGINGCASVLSPILATLGAVHFGFDLVVVGGLALYLLAAGAFPRQARAAQTIPS